MKLHRRIQPKAVVEHETVSLRLAAALLRPVDRYAKYLGGKTDRTHVVAQDLQIALAQDVGLRKTLAARPTAPASGPGHTDVRPRPRHGKAVMTSPLEDALTAGGIRPASPAPSRHTAVSTPALSAIPGGLSPLTLS